MLKLLTFFFFLPMLSFLPHSLQNHNLLVRADCILVTVSRAVFQHWSLCYRHGSWMREGQTGVIGLWDEVSVVTWTFSSHKAEALLSEDSQAVSFPQDTMASESPGNSSLSLFLSSFVWNGRQFDINSLKGKKRKRWFKSRRYISFRILNMVYLLVWNLLVVNTSV